MTASASLAGAVPALLARVKPLLDLACRPDEIAAALGPLARGRIRACACPGAVDGFEIAVRAILGQQVTVAAATTIAGRFAGAFGEPIDTPHDGARPPLPDRRAHRGDRAVGDRRPRHHRLARARHRGARARGRRRRRCASSPPAPVEETLAALERMPGIGPWTAQYIAMRALAWPDAFPHPDVAVLKAMRRDRTAGARCDAPRPGGPGAPTPCCTCGNRSRTSPAKRTGTMTRYARLTTPARHPCSPSPQGGALVGLRLRRRASTRRRSRPRGARIPHASPLRDCARAARRLLRGQAAVASTCPLAPRGTPFQQRVWREIAKVPFGETITYARARRAGGLARLGPRRRRRHGPQSARPRRALPPHRGRGRRAHRLRRRPRPQGAPPRARRRTGGGRRLRPADLGRLLPARRALGRAPTSSCASRCRTSAPSGWSRAARSPAGWCWPPSSRVTGATSPRSRGTGAATSCSASLAVALPFWLIGTAVKTIDASTAAILNATSPIFSAIVAVGLDPRAPHRGEGRGHRPLDRGHRDPRGLDAEADDGRGAPRLLALARWPAPATAAASVFTKVHLKEAPPARALDGELPRRRRRRWRPSRRGPSSPRRCRPLAWAAVAGARHRLHRLRVHPLLPAHRRPRARCGRLTVTLLIPVFGILWGVLLPRRAPHARAHRRLRDRSRWAVRWRSACCAFRFRSAG